MVYFLLSAALLLIAAFGIGAIVIFKEIADALVDMEKDFHRIASVLKNKEENDYLESASSEEEKIRRKLRLGMQV